MIRACRVCGRELPAEADRSAADEPGRSAQASRPAFDRTVFCSPACKLADLGKWLDGSYRIPGEPVEITGDDLRRKEDDA